MVLLSSKEKHAMITVYNSVLKHETEYLAIICVIRGLEKVLDNMGYKFEYEPPYGYWAIDVVEKEDENA